MTALLMTKFKKEIFVFADGRVTRNMTIQTDKCKKIFEAANGTIIASAGDVGAEFDFISGMNNNMLDKPYLSTLQGSGLFLVANKKNFMEYEYDNTKPLTKDNEDLNYTNITISTFNFEEGPIAGGCGGDGVLMAYKALKADKAQTRKQYIDLVREAFKVNASVNVFCSELFMFKTIKL